jgi:DnaJ-like protein
MRQDIHRYFNALGLSPGASADDIRVAYRRLIQEWHPDRFAVGSLMQTTAEDQTKDLNEAYEWLYKKRHYRRFLGTAGKAHRPASEAEKSAEASDADPKEPSRSAGGVRPTPPPARRPWPAFARSLRFWKMMGLTTVVAAAALLLIPRIGPPLAALWRAQTGAPASVLRIPTPTPPSAASASPAEPAASTAVPAAAVARTASTALAPGTPQIETAERQAIPTQVESEQTAPELERATPVRIATRLAEDVAATPTAFRSSAPEAARDSGWGGASPQPELGQRADPIPLSEISPEIDAPQAGVLSGVEMDTRLDEAETHLDTFDVGDSAEWVKIVQGRPDEAVEGAFRYGSSIVTFDKGRVSGWTNGEPRLRVSWLSFADVEDRLDAFTIGSTRGEVFEIQGNPDSASADAYIYGTDAVYFQNDRVISWTQNDERLRTRFMPTLPFFDPHVSR